MSKAKVEQKLAENPDLAHPYLNSLLEAMAIVETTKLQLSQLVQDNTNEELSECILQALESIEAAEEAIDNACILDEPLPKFDDED